MKRNMTVRKLLNKDNWTKGCKAREINNESVDTTSPEAYKYCIVGAIYKCYPEKKFRLIARITEVKKLDSLIRWNDAPERTWEDIEALIKEFDL